MRIFSIRLRPVFVFALLSGFFGFAGFTYAGPLDDLQPGHWYEFPNSNLDQLDPCPLENCSYSGAGGIEGIMGVWSGGAFDTSRNRLLIWGGGHARYGGNEIYGFDLDDGTWTRISEPSTNVDECVNPNDNPAGCDGYYPDGLPASRHTYNDLQYDAMNDRLVSMGTAAVFGPNGNGASRGVDAYDFGTNQWLRLGEPAVGVGAGSWSAYHPVTGKLYTKRSQGAQDLVELNPQTETFSYSSYNSGYVIYSPADIDPDRNILTMVGGGIAHVYDLNQAGYPRTTVSTSGTQVVQDDGAFGFVFDPVIKKYVAWKGDAGDTTSVYTLDPANWTWQKVTAAPTNTVTPTAESIRGTYGRWRYSPASNVFVVVNGVSQNVYAYKMSAGPGQLPPNVTLSASPMTINNGETSTLTWTISDATSCTRSGSWSGGLTPSDGSQQVTPNNTSTYSLSCTNDNGTTTRNTTVTVGAALPVPTVSLSATPTVVSDSATTLLTWSSTDADSCQASGGWSGNKATDNLAGENSPAITATTTFSLTCTNSSGNGSDSVTVTVSATPPSTPTVNLSTSETSVDNGSSVTLSWAPIDADVCNASGDWGGVKNAKGGSEAVGPLTMQSTFSLTCQGDGGESGETVEVAINNDPNVAPTLTFSASPTTLSSGESTTLSWSSTNTTSCEASGSWSGMQATSGSSTQQGITENSSYTLTCTGDGGSAGSTVSVVITATLNNDSDNDGLPDDWEQINFGNLAQTANGDADGDGFTNLQEQLANSDPNDADSVPADEEDSGGGSMGWLVLLFVLFIGLRLVRYNILHLRDAVIVMGCLIGFSSSAFAADPLEVGLENLQPGHWYKYNNSRMDVEKPCPGALPACNNFKAENVGAVMGAWGSGAFDSVGNRLLVWGGGHSDYGGNELYAFSVETGQWARLTDPSVAPYADGDGAYYPDGKPQSRHSYGHLQFDPLRNDFYSLAAAATFGPASDSLRATDAFDLDTMTWIVKPAGPNLGGLSVGGSSAYDAAINMFWVYDTNGSKLRRFNPADNSWDSFGNISALIHTTADVDLSRNLLVYIGRDRLGYFDLSDLDGSSSYITASGSPGIEGNQGPAFAYDPGEELFVAWGIGNLSSVYTLNPDTWTWNTLQAAPTNTVTPTAPPGQGTYGRFRYIPEYNVYILVNATDEDVYLYKLSDGAGTPAAPSINLSANPAQVTPNGMSELLWTVSNADSCVASGDWSGAKNANSGNQTVGPLAATSTFTLECEGPGGTRSASATVTVNNATPTPTVTLNANPTQVEIGETTLLTWSSTDADSCVASDGWSGNKATENLAGENSTALNETTSFTLTCSNNSGDGEDSVTVTVTDPQAPAPVVNLSASATSVDSGSMVTLSWAPTDANVCIASGDWGSVKNSKGGSETVGPLTMQSTFSLTCQGDGGESGETVEVAINNDANVAPTLTFSASPTTITSGESTTLTWTSASATSCEASGSWSGMQATSGSSTQQGITENSSYTLTCTGDAGSAGSTVSVAVTDTPNNDSDNDGLPDDWEQANFGNLDQDANDDVDGDGFTNLQEQQANSDPNDVNSVPVAQEDSGGGSTGKWLLLFMGLLIVSRIQSMRMVKHSHRMD